MRDLLKIFERRYSVVNVSDMNFPSNINNNTVEDNVQYLQQIGFNHRKKRKSLQASRSIKQGFTIVDYFFTVRKNGRRYPKCKSEYFVNKTKLLCLLLKLCRETYLFMLDFILK